VARLAGLDSTPFQAVIDDLPKNAVAIAVRFAVPGGSRRPVAMAKPPRL
jgi:hypothetical protein